MMSRFFLWLCFAVFIMPPLRLVDLGFGIGLFDLFSAIFFLAVSISLLRGREFLLPRNETIPFSYLAYIFTIIFLSLIGMLIFSSPIDWVVGDLRWLVFMCLLFSVSIVYSARQRHLITTDAFRFIWVITLLQVPFIVSQLAMVTFGSSPNLLLTLWWLDAGAGGVGVYGHHISRYTGSFAHFAHLALLGGIAFLVGALSVERDNRISILLAVLGLFCMLSSGNRGMIFLAPIFLVMSLIARSIKNGKIGTPLLFSIIFFTVIGPFLFFIAFQLDLGRIASTERLQTVSQWIAGEASFADITGGRGGDRWILPIEESRRLYSPLGTIVNSARALEHLPAMDSYFVVMWAQAGPLITLPFAFLCFLLIRRSFILPHADRKTGAFVQGTMIALLASTVTQNTMTGLHGRAFLTVCVMVAAWGASYPYPRRASRALIVGPNRLSMKARSA